MAMQSWDEIRAWRRERRASLIAERQAIPQAERQRLQPVITGRLADQFPELRSGTIGFYWPIRSEIGVAHLIRELIEAGASAALPVVVGKKEPLEFRAWRPGTPLERGVWDIPVPAERQVVRPTVLLVPLVGFDEQGYRLGYGGGYYDRTLAASDPRPLAIGVGYELSRLATIYPQAHDVPMDAIATEAGVRRFERLVAGSLAPRPAIASPDEDPNVETVGYSSPPCFMHELDDR
jgi:5-formyltetrahydrofolate cyclo-ligase